MKKIFDAQSEIAESCLLHEKQDITSKNENDHNSTLDHPAVRNENFLHYSLYKDFIKHYQKKVIRLYVVQIAFSS